MHTSEYDYLFKLLLIGDSGVGKVSRAHPHAVTYDCACSSRGSSVFDHP